MFLVYIINVCTCVWWGTCECVTIQTWKLESDLAGSAFLSTFLLVRGMKLTSSAYPAALSLAEPSCWLLGSRTFKPGILRRWVDCQKVQTIWNEHRIYEFITLLKSSLRARGMAQLQLKVPDTFAEDWSLVLSIRVRWLTATCNSSSRGSHAVFLFPQTNPHQHKYKGNL